MLVSTAGSRLSLAVIWVVLALAGCHHKQQRAAVAPATPVVIPPIIVPVTAPVPVPSPISGSLPTPAAPPTLDQADLAFASGSYDEAIQAYEDYLVSSSGDQRDQALFRLGISYALKKKPGSDWARATAYLKQLAMEYPESPLIPQATLILTLHSQTEQLAKDAKTRDQAMRQLSTELERLKKIDADRRKRP